MGAHDNTQATNVQVQDHTTLVDLIYGSMHHQVCRPKSTPKDLPSTPGTVQPCILRVQTSRSKAQTYGHIHALELGPNYSGVEVPLLPRCECGYKNVRLEPLNIRRRQGAHVEVVATEDHRDEVQPY